MKREGRAINIEYAVPCLHKCYMLHSLGRRRDIPKISDHYLRKLVMMWRGGCISKDCKQHFTCIERYVKRVIRKNLYFRNLKANYLLLG
jgi:hypothetical protein